MLKLLQILCRPLAPAALAVAAAVAVSACGQRGPLYLPTEPAAAGRATLPQTLSPMNRAAAAPQAAASAPLQPSSAPIR